MSQVRARDVDARARGVRARTAWRAVHALGRAAAGDAHRDPRAAADAARRATRIALRGVWSETHARRCRRCATTRRCADEEHAARIDASDPGLSRAAHVRPRRGRRRAVHRDAARAPARRDPARAGRQRPDRDGGGVRPRRLRGGRRPHDRPARGPRRPRATSAALAACGGFSFGDVLGAGEGWAKSILFNAARARRVRGVLRAADTFALGVCNGCQMVADLQRAHPGRATRWPRFVRNRSEQFEARLVAGAQSRRARRCFFAGWRARALPIAVAHGEGRAEFGAPTAARRARAAPGSSRRASSITAGASPSATRPTPTARRAASPRSPRRDGRVTIIMPHPERVFRTVQYSWHPREWGEDGPWMRMFRNARAFVG